MEYRSLDTAHAVVKAVVQGLTEFLPVSSSAHLIFTDAFSRSLGWQHPNPVEEECYDILLHLGTLLAVIFYFRRDLWLIGQSFLKQSITPEAQQYLHPFDVQLLPVHIGVTTIVTMLFAGIVGILSEQVMTMMRWTGENVHNLQEFYRVHPQWVAVNLVFTGCFLFFTEHFSQTVTNKAKAEAFTLKHAILIGVFQGVSAVFRGISRSGSTISGGLVSGVDRVTATRYAFLISIPVFLVAAGYEAIKIAKLGIAGNLNWFAMGVGVIVTMVVAYYCVKYFIRYVAKHGLKGFAFYCWVMGAAMCWYFG